MYEYLQGRSDLVLNGFESVEITEAVEKSKKSLKELKTLSLLLEMIRTKLRPIRLLVFKVV